MELQDEIRNMKRDFVSLEDRIEDTEAYERRDTVVVPGSEIHVVTESENNANIVTNSLRIKWVGWLMHQAL